MGLCCWQSLEVENDFLDDLRVRSVPPQVSDVVKSKDKGKICRGKACALKRLALLTTACSELFWRYDMHSYAANRHNEDRSQYVMDVVETDSIQTPVFFCACYDGHGGEEAVEFVQRNLYANIKSHLVAGEENVTQAIIKGFKDTDQEFTRQSRLQFEHGSWNACSVGACAVVALMVGKRLFVASCGDCRAILAVREPDGSLGVEQVTFDHSANEEREQRRLRVLYPNDRDIVREVGTNNFYVKGRLQPTRSIGDTYMKFKEVNKAPMPRGLRIHGDFTRPYITGTCVQLPRSSSATLVVCTDRGASLCVRTAVPDVFEVDLKQRHPEFLVLGSDGLYGELSNLEIVKMVAQYRKDGVANVSVALRTSILERIADYYGLTATQMEMISPGDRRNYHDDITIDVLHFAPPTAEPA